MYLNICYIYVLSKYYESKKSKTTYILKQSEYILIYLWRQQDGDRTLKKTLDGHRSLNSTIARPTLEHLQEFSISLLYSYFLEKKNTLSNSSPS